MSRVRVGIFSLTPPAPRDDDGSYLRWHLLDHMPEQFQLPGMLHALRWIADGEYPRHRIAAVGPLEQVGNVVNYLVGDPVQQTLDEFMALGPRLRELGRFPERRPSLLLRMLDLLQSHASPGAVVSAEVLPWRPHRGVLLVVEEPVGGAPDDWLNWLEKEHHSALLDVPGVAGVSRYGSSDRWTLPAPAQGDPQYLTVVYLDGDPLTVTGDLAPLVEQRWASGAVRPLFAGPLRTMIQWDAWPT